MKRGNKPTGFILVCFPILIFFSCHPSQPIPQEIFFTLEADGAFTPGSGFPSLAGAAFAPWPQKTRVTDLLSRDGRIYLTVNGLGLAELTAAKGEATLVTRYEPNYFSGRTVTRFFSSSDAFYCHVYFDTSFPESVPVPPPAARFALLKITPTPAGISFTPRSFSFQANNEPWEAVGASLLNSDTLLLEWKTAKAGRTLFRYSTCALAGGREEEKSKEWFYNLATIGSPAQASDPVAVALMESAAQTLASESPGCVVMFSLLQGEGGPEKRYLSRGESNLKKAAARYYSVRLVRTTDEISLLFEDGRYLVSRTTAAAGRAYQQLPVLPPGGRYTALAVTPAFLCAAWEQFDFYKVGSSGIVFRPREAAGDSIP